ncbi:FMN-dependent NADH-azoreductase [Bordetella sp. BOR01]|uniref:FMN-dependent NADH-azoreductase n=1 Tax=Bordetella sp. BOR01 TaxID=2854779 RepID=UPI001C484B26|nr:NAD(P)H-dependent oxidoreductase [Bordetella sp. BOR01]MBV7484242.1 NAD(P)H-dependent oxidoreductase [Bordetella sp. BOR01]
MKTLVILASILGDRSRSNQLADHLIQRLRQLEPAGSIQVRDLGADPIPYFDGATAGALFTPADQRTAAQSAMVARSDALIAELFDADRIVFAVPVYNFSLPAQLKSYIDYIARAGVTFRYTPEGVSEGLLKGKQVLVLSTRGGKARGTPSDTLTPYLTQILAFVGLADPVFITAEGMALGELAAQEGLAQARQHIDALVQAQPPQRRAA